MIAAHEIPSTPSVPKSRRRQVDKSSKQERPPLLKIGLHLTEESWRRLGITSTMERRSQSEIIDELIRLHLRKYVISVRSARPEESPNITQEVSTT